MLHPDLDSLRSQYNQVLDELEAGNMSHPEAVSSVQAMSVIDGGGYVWLIDTATGGFLRAVPGETPQEEDPSKFMSARIPSPGSSPWASQQDLLQPPTSTRRPQARQPQHDYDDEDDDQSSMMGRRQGSQQNTSSARSGSRLPSVKLPPLLERNKRLLLIVSVLTVALIVFSRFSKDAPDPTIVSGVPVPSSITPTPLPVEPLPTLPPETVPTEAPAPAPLPTDVELESLKLAIVSGDRTQVAAAVVKEESPRRVAFYTARYYGYNATGLQIQFAAPVLVNGRVFVSTSLVDSASGEVVTTRKVRLRRVDGDIWQFAQLIDFEA